MFERVYLGYYIKAGNRSIASKGNDKSTESAGRRKQHTAQMDG